MDNLSVGWEHVENTLDLHGIISLFMMLS